MAQLTDPSNRFEHLEKSGYGDPISEALVCFWRFCHSTDRIDDGDVTFTDTAFAKKHREVLCLYDLAYLWLIEGNGTEKCPTFESWLVFLVAFADEVHRFREGSVIPAWDNCVTEHAIPEERLSQFDLFFWGARADVHRSNDQYGSPRLDEEGFRHLVLRRDVYEAARERYQQHH